MRCYLNKLHRAITFHLRYATYIMETPLNNDQKIRLFLAIAGTILLWSSTFPAIKFALESYSPTSVACLRFFISAIVLGIIAIRKKVKRPDLKDCPYFFMLAFSGVFAYQLLLNYGEKLTNAGTAGFVIGTTPIFTILISHFVFHEKMSIAKIAGVVACFFGVYCIALSKGTHWVINHGLLYLCCGAFCWSIYFIVQKILLKKYAPLQVVCFVLWIASILFLGVSHPSKILQTLIYGRIGPSLSIVYLGLFPTVIAYGLWAYVLSHMQASKAALYTYFIPFISAFFSHFLLGETYNDYFFLGGLFILSGLLITNRNIMVYFVRIVQPSRQKETSKP